MSDTNQGTYSSIVHTTETSVTSGPSARTKRVGSKALSVFVKFPSIDCTQNTIDQRNTHQHNTNNAWSSSHGRTFKLSKSTVSRCLNKEQYSADRDTPLTNHHHSRMGLLLHLHHFVRSETEPRLSSFVQQTRCCNPRTKPILGAHQSTS